ncbi:MAG: polymer-forming cytoskeletal protein [Candidatus Aminicenantes bacterium]|nr:polymer-forming cytoskeletal protein [Candidatus Aminicenantes bacterium]
MGMFKKDEVSAAAEPAVSYSGSLDSERSRSIIGKNLFLKGEMSSDEEVLIEGKVKGKIKINHRLIIGANGNVTADIDAKEVIIKGMVTGNVKCSEKIEIVPAGILKGNIFSNKVILAEGAIFKGNIDMATGEEKIAAKTEEIVDAEIIDETKEGKQAKKEAGLDATENEKDDKKANKKKK